MLHRIAEIIDSSGVTQAQVAVHLEMAPQNFSRMLKNDDIKLGVLIKIAEYLKVDISDLIVEPSGKKKSQKAVGLSGQQPPGSFLVPKIVTVDSDGNDNIVYIPIKARAGYLLGYGDPEFITTLPSFHLPGLRNGTFRMFEVDGPSMAPTINHNDKIIGSWIESIADIRDNRIHIIVTRTGIVIKRILNRIKERGKIYLKSDTLTHRHDFPTVELDPEEIVEVWYAQLLLSASFREPTELYRRISDLEIEVLELKKHR